MMDPPFSDGGQPSSYTNDLLPVNAQQSGCVSDFTAMDHLNTLSSNAQENSIHLSGVSSLPSESIIQQSHHLYNTNAYTSIASNPRYLSQSHHQFWPSPSPGPGDIEDYSYHSSPVLGSNQQFYRPSPISPRTWSPTDETFQQAVEALQVPFPPHDTVKDTRICAPVLTNECSSYRPYTGNFHQSFKTEVDGMPQQEAPAIAPDYPSGTSSYMTSPSEPAAATPDLVTATEDDSPPSEPNDSLSPPRQQETIESNTASERPKNEEPYAQLIYKAFMSSPKRALTLQEIYQWFRDNTDKADGEGKGWQNSIRHNLSMNKAFIKRDRKESQEPSSNLADPPLLGESKRSTEWVLEDWAIRDGVQSTTRYRKGIQARRGHALGSTKAFRHQSYSHGFYDGYQISTKSHSGRKIATAVTKPTMRNRHYSHGTTMTPTTHQRNLPHTLYTAKRPLVSSFFPNSGQNQMAPRSEPSSHLMMKPDPFNSSLNPSTAASVSYNFSMPEQSLVQDGASGTIDSATYTLLGVGQGHLYVGPSPCEYPFGTADVTGVYQPEHHSAGVGGSRPFDGFQHGVYGWTSHGI